MTAYKSLVNNCSHTSLMWLLSGLSNTRRHWVSLPTGCHWRLPHLRMFERSWTSLRYVWHLLVRVYILILILLHHEEPHPVPQHAWLNQVRVAKASNKSPGNRAYLAKHMKTRFSRQCRRTTSRSTDRKVIPACAVEHMEQGKIQKMHLVISCHSVIWNQGERGRLMVCNSPHLNPIHVLAIMSHRCWSLFLA